MRMLCVMACVLSAVGAAGADYAVDVELENLSGKAQTDWPVIVNVWAVLGRNLPAGSVNPSGFRVTDSAGKDLPWAVEPIPPYDVPGNDELIFVVPKMAAKEKITVRIANTARPTSKPAKIDLASDPHNLMKNGGFESAAGGKVAAYKGGRLDSAVKRSGKSSLLVSGNRGVRVAYEPKIPLTVGCPYYAGVWCKTDNVARHGLAAGRGAYFAFAAADKSSGFRMASGYRGVRLATQCGTRDWNKSRWWSRYAMDYDDWGVHRNTAVAERDAANLTLVLDQRRQYVLRAGDATGKWWLDDFVLMPQPKVTVRFDKTVGPLMKPAGGGKVFLFTRPASSTLGFVARKKSPKTPEFCCMPFAHESAGKLDAIGLRGQRVPYLLGVYHTGALKGVGVSVAGGRIAAGDSKIAVESVEYSEGFLRPVRTHVLQSADGAVDFAGPRGVRYFVVTFKIPADAKPGRYEGRLDVAVGGKAFGSIPLTLRVQDLDLPEIDDVYVGYIFQGTRLLTKEGVAMYARSGFTSLTVFGGFLPYKPLEGGQQQVDIEALDKKMQWLAASGIKAVCLYTEVELDPQWVPGRLFRKSGGTKATYQREIKRLAAAAKAHPKWPRIIYMIWDEPAGHGGIQPKLAWVNEADPDAWTTLDVDFANLPKAIKYVNTPCLDNPADCTGPELYEWIRKQGKRFGYCGKATNGECTRYQMGLWMIVSGAVLQQPWHLEGHQLMDMMNKKPYRSIGLVACGQGVDDLKVHRLLASQIKAAGADPSKAGAVKQAKDYLKKVFAVWNGDTAHVSLLMPHLGWGSTWGYEQFYDDWQEAMARHAARLKGVRWID